MDLFKNHPLYRKHNIDSAMSSLWEFYRSRFISLFIISLGMSIIIQIISSSFDFTELQTITDPVALMDKMKDYLTPMLIISVVNLLFSTIFQYYVLYNPIDNNNTIFVCIIKSLKYFLPYLVMMVILAFAGSIAIVLGVFAFVIGAVFAALYVLMIYMFILPIMMTEDSSISTTITRTISLSHRNFWSNFGWVTVFLITLIVLYIMLSALILLPFSGNFLKTIMNQDNAATMIEITRNPIYIALSTIVNALTLPLMSIFASILYFNGKAGEEKESEENLNGNNIVRVEDLYAKPYADDHPDNPDK
jgi:hypothetical protein